MAHEPQMAEAAEQLISHGYEINIPDASEAYSESEINANPGLKNNFIKNYFAKIDESDAVLVVNEDKNGVNHYIGGNTLIEMSHAYAQGLEVFLLNPVPELQYKDEIMAMSPIVLDGSIDKINTYVDSLPLVHMSTTSHPKQRAVSRAMRRVGIPVRVSGEKVPSGVSEQPMTMEETYEGAMNRHKALLETSIKADYYCTIESGFDLVHANHNLFGCSVLLFNKAKSDIEVGVEFDIEFPQEIFDEVPSKYPDVGVLIQQKYGSKHKDAYPFLTEGRLTRQTILENAMFSLLVKSKEVA